MEFSRLIIQKIQMNKTTRQPDVNENRLAMNESSRDMKDSPKDKARLQPDEATLDLPDVKDIPGQEFIHVPPLGELADTTIASDDEEGTGLFNDDKNDETMIQIGTEDSLPQEDKRLLQQQDERMLTDEEDRLRKATLDNRDNEGELLNERNNQRTGSDLDTSGVESDDANEFIGDEDEENNTYSLGGDEREAENNNGTIGIP
jgi:hypothetical protein